MSLARRLKAPREEELVVAMLPRLSVDAAGLDSMPLLATLDKLRLLIRRSLSSPLLSLYICRLSGRSLLSTVLERLARPKSRRFSLDGEEGLEVEVTLSRVPTSSRVKERMLSLLGDRIILLLRRSGLGGTVPCTDCLSSVVGDVEADSLGISDADSLGLAGGWLSRSFDMLARGFSLPSVPLWYQELPCPDTPK